MQLKYPGAAVISVLLVLPWPSPAFGQDALEAADPERFCAQCGEYHHVPPPHYIFTSKPGPDQLRVEVGGFHYNILEVFFQDDAYRELFPHVFWLPCPPHGCVNLAPHGPGGCFAVMSPQLPEKLIVYGWKRMHERNKTVVSFSPLSDSDNLPFRLDPSAPPIQLTWISPQVVRLTQVDPRRPASDQEIVRVVRFNPQNGLWQLIVPAPPDPDNPPPIKSRTPSIAGAN